MKLLLSWLLSAPRTHLNQVNQWQSIWNCALIILVTAIVAPPSAHAMKFSNQFVEFELPYNWKCGLEGAEWVCQSQDEQKKRDAIIVLAAKLKGDQDTLDKYQEYLNKPRKFNLPGGKEVISQPKYANNKTMNGQVWADSMHTDSEIPNFFTRYLATVYQDIAVLVTYSVNKTKFADYQKQFDDMVTSMKVFRKQGGMNTQLAAANTNLFNQVSKPSLPGLDTGEGAVGQAQGGANKSKGSSDSGNMGLLALVAVGIAGFLYIKKKREGGA